MNLYLLLAGRRDGSRRGRLGQLCQGQSGCQLGSAPESAAIVAGARRPRTPIKS